MDVVCVESLWSSWKFIVRVDGTLALVNRVLKPFNHEIGKLVDRLKRRI